MSIKTDLSDEFGAGTKVLFPIFQELGGKADLQRRAVTVKRFEGASRIQELGVSPGYGGVKVNALINEDAK